MSATVLAAPVYSPASDRHYAKVLDGLEKGDTLARNNYYRKYYRFHPVTHGHALHAGAPVQRGPPRAPRGCRREARRLLATTLQEVTVPVTSWLLATTLQAVIVTGNKAFDAVRLLATAVTGTVRLEAVRLLATTLQEVTAVFIKNKGKGKNGEPSMVTAYGIIEGIRKDKVQADELWPSGHIYTRPGSEWQENFSSSTSASWCGCTATARTT